MRLHKSGGFSFNGVTVNNTNGIYLAEVNRPYKPTLTRYDMIAPKRHGSISYANRYEDKIINVQIAIIAKTVQERRQKQRELIAPMLGAQGKLIFFDEPNLFYYAEIFDEITEAEDGPFTYLNITFKCSPFKYELYDDLRDYTVNELTMIVDELGVLVNRAYWDNITSSTIKQIENTGNFESYPVIELQGTATLVQMQFEDIQFSFSNLNNETIYIDSENMIVYKIVGGDKVSVLPRFYGPFPTIPAGETDVMISGTSLNVNITVDFKNTFIV